MLSDRPPHERQPVRDPSDQGLHSALRFEERLGSPTALRGGAMLLRGLRVSREARSPAERALPFALLGFPRAGFRCARKCVRSPSRAQMWGRMERAAIQPARRKQMAPQAGHATHLVTQKKEQIKALKRKQNLRSRAPYAPKECKRRSGFAQGDKYLVHGSRPDPIDGVVKCQNLNMRHGGHGSQALRPTRLSRFSAARDVARLPWLYDLSHGPNQELR